MRMGNINSGKRLYEVNRNFFKVWSSKMAYILGFTCADGNVHGRTLAWDLSDKHISNIELLKSFNIAMESNYPLKKRDKSYRLRVSNQMILKDIGKLGIVPNKKKILTFPDVPKNYLRHFIRGFLDGDGWIVSRVRSNGGREVCVGFSNGSYAFMLSLAEILASRLGLKDYNLRKREKKMKNGDLSYCYQLEYYSKRANMILELLYGSLDSEDLMLGRKYERMIVAKANFLEEEKRKEMGALFYNYEQDKNIDVIDFVGKCYWRERLLPREIADQLGVSLSALYRFMNKFKIKDKEYIRYGE